MDKQLLSFRSIAYQDKDNTYTGVCLDLDIIEEGHTTMQEAVYRLNDAIMTHLQASAKLGYPKELMERPAPKEYWVILEEMVHAKPNGYYLKPFQFSTLPQYAAV